MKSFKWLWSVTVGAFFVFCLFSEVFAFQGHHPSRAEHAMVATAAPLASEVGLQILRQGGNAVDAAVAVGFALEVVYPEAGNIGGGGFMVIRFPDGRATTIDYREKAPLKATRDMYLDKNGNVIPGLSLKGYLACGVPGSVKGLWLAHRRYGKLPWKTLIEPAIQLAEKGFPISYEFSQEVKRHESDLKDFPATAKLFFKNGTTPYEPGERFVQKDLAHTLRLIAEKGSDGFYKGEVAERIESVMKANGGLITRQDLAAYQAKERPPVEGTYHDYHIISMGPPSSGGICLLEILNILEGYSLKTFGFHSSKTIHLMVEAEKRAYADRAKHLGDSDFYPVPVKGLLSKKYAAALRESIDPNRATPSTEIFAGNPLPYESKETTHYAIVDENRMAVSVTTTLNSAFGSKVVVDGAGFLLNDEMDDFSSKPGFPNKYGLIGGEANSIQPGKRMLSSMTPTILEKNGRLFMVVGTPGGSTIITSVLQTILNVVDFGMNIQEAVDAPRFHHQWLPDQIFYDRFAFPVDVCDNLKKMGYRLHPRHSNGPGIVQAILVDPKSGVLLGGSDSRGYGRALGF
ncbi:MAG: gamma-glutamyltransferase [Calditrichaeota bacterium]|nr:gamma-glutamyltransferase [Calditrichota bacterium]